jgi:endonuclease/exonuclease/phosphatase family metal-dependent hydrolase
MWFKVVLITLCVLMIAAAIHFDPARQRSLLLARPAEGPHLKLMTWNIGYAELEDDSRAHTKDLQLVAQTILRNDPDAVALQELTGAEQLRVLLSYLQGKYGGAVATPGSADRVEAVLLKSTNGKLRVERVPAGERFFVAAEFQTQPKAPEIVFISAHADAFSSARRRVFTGDVVDWSQAHAGNALVFIAGDFNFELRSSDDSHLYSDNVKNDSEAYSYLLKYFRDLGRDAGDTAVNDRRIDYVFGPAESVFRRKVEVLRGTGAEQMDHWPLIVEVALDKQ